MHEISGIGSIYFHKRQNKWTAQYYETTNGIKKRKSIYGKTKEDVQLKLAELQYNYHNDNYIKTHGIPLIKVLELNREEKYNANLISESHYSRLDFVLKEIARSELGNKNVENITSKNIQDYLNSLITRYTDSSIKKIWEQLKQGFEICQKSTYILKNPFENVRKPKSRIPTKIIEALTIEEQEKLSNYLMLSTTQEEKYKNAFLIQLYTGLRVGEVLALAKQDINLDKKILKVSKTITVDKDGLLVLGKTTKTYSGIREIPIPNFLAEIIQNQLENYSENHYQLLFTYKNRIIKPSTLNTVLKRICRKLDLPSTISTHTLRHTFGTRCIESGMPAVVVQKLLGHKDIKVTLNTYTSVFNRFKTAEMLKAVQYYQENNFLALPTKKLDDEDYYLREDDIEYFFNKITSIKNR